MPGIWAKTRMRNGSNRDFTHHMVYVMRLTAGGDGVRPPDSLTGTGMRFAAERLDIGNRLRVRQCAFGRHGSELEKTCEQIDCYRGRGWAENSRGEQAAPNPFLTGLGHPVATEKRNLAPGVLDVRTGLLKSLTRTNCHGIILGANGHQVDGPRC